MSDAPRTIVIGVDYSDQSIAAVDEALRVSSSVRGARLVPVLVLHASTLAGAPDVEEMTRELVARASDNLSQLLVARAQRLGISAPERVEPQVRFGSPADELLAASRDLRADLLALGTHGRQGLSHLLVGSVAEEVMRKATCSVLVARTTQASAAASAGAMPAAARAERPEPDTGKAQPPTAEDDDELTIVAGPHIDAGRVVLHVLDVPTHQVFVCAFENETGVSVDPLEGSWVPAPSSAARARVARTALRASSKHRGQFAELFAEISRRRADH
jgi:universal stress protein A